MKVLIVLNRRFLQFDKEKAVHNLRTAYLHILQIDSVNAIFLCPNGRIEICGPEQGPLILVL